MIRLEDELKVQSFRNDRQRLTVNLIYTYNWMVTELQATFKKYGLTMQQFNILRILRGQHPQPSSVQLLKERMIDKQPDVSRLVDRLFSKNLVERKVCKDDRRKSDIIISSRGLDLLKQMDQEIEELDHLADALNDGEVRTLNELLDKIRG